MDTKKILIVDDDQVTLTLLSRKMSDAGYEVIEAKTGQQAVKLAQKHIPDVVLMDIILPDINGAEAVKDIMEDSSTKNADIIFLSSIADKKDAATTGGSIKVGNKFFDIIPKPIDIDETLSKVRKLINDEL